MNEPNIQSKPPKLAIRFLKWFCKPDLVETIEGDLQESFTQRVNRVGEGRAKRLFWLEVFGFFKPAYTKKISFKSSMFLFSHDMIRNYFKVAWRNLVKNKAFSFINVAGLSLGMAVAMLIGLWIHDEVSYDRYFENYDRIAKVMQGGTFEGTVFKGGHMPYPMGEELRTVFGQDFKYVVMSSWTNDHILAFEDKKFTQSGNYFSPEAPDLLSLKMVEGTRQGLRDPASILLSQSAAEALFGTQDPMGKIMKIDNKLNVKVTGVYEDMPYNTEFRDVKFIAPWDLYVSSEDWVKRARDNAEWGNHSWQILAQIGAKADFDQVSKKISNLRIKHEPETAFLKPEVFLHPMSKWHLYTGWDKKGNLDARIQYVWLFGIIGVFVLFLACINFMNLSTARSEKRAREVGVRKAVGSVRAQLVGQFFSESLLVVGLAFLFSILLVLLVLPVFNEVADKKIGILWTNPIFWTAGVVFCLITGIIAGSYPALYLSSFDPIKVLKGTFRVGRFAGLPRRVLVVVQFTVSVTLIIGTVIVFRQIQFAKNRPVGYDRNGLITIWMNTPELYQHYNLLRDELIKTGAVVDMSTSSTPTTNLNSQNAGFEWEGKDPVLKANFGTIAVSHDFGRTVGWKFKQGRDFSRQFSTDSSGIVLNETAVRYMGLKNPIGKLVSWNGTPFHVVGVIEDMIMSSPFDPPYQTVFMLNYNWAGVISIKLNPTQSATESLTAIEKVFKKFNPGSPFDFQFSDQQYALKFAAEERIGKLASGFAILAVVISCLGLFGLAWFVAEQRTKEIGVRKVLGASVLNLWGLLSKDFIGLVMIALVISGPIAYYFLNNWLDKYQYRTEISWWIFVYAGAGAIVVTLLTVSYQSIKAALLNPVKSLRSE